jgi:hypothetical protein
MPPFNKNSNHVLFIYLINENVANHLKTIRRKIFNNSITIRGNVYNHPISTFNGITLKLS